MLNNYPNNHYSIGKGTIRVDQLRYLNLIPGFVAAYGNKILIYDTRQLSGYSIFQKLDEYDLFIGLPGESYRCDLTHIKFKKDPWDAVDLDQNVVIPDTLKKTLAVCKFKRYYGYGKSHKPAIYDIEHNYMAYVIINKEYLNSKIFSFAVNYVDGGDPIAVIGMRDIESGFAVPLREFVFCIAESIFDDGSHRISTIMDTIPDLIENTKITSKQKAVVDSVIGQVYHLTNGYVFLGHLLLVSSEYMNMSKLAEIPELHYVLVHAPHKHGEGCDIQLTDGLCDYGLIVVEGLEKMSMNAVHDGEWHKHTAKIDSVESATESITSNGAFVSLNDPNVRSGKSPTYSPKVDSANIFVNREYVRSSIPGWQSSGSPIVVRFGRIPVYLDEMKAALAAADAKWPLASDVVSKAAIEADVEASAAESAPVVSETPAPEKPAAVQAVAQDPAKEDHERGITAILAEAYEYVPDFGAFAATANAICLLRKGKALSVSAIGGTAKYVKFAQGTKSVSGVSDDDFSDIVDYVLSRVSTVDMSGMEFDSDGQQVVLFFRNLELKNPNFVSKFVNMASTRTSGGGIFVDRSATFMGIAVTPPYRDLYKLAYSIGATKWPGDIFPQDYSGGKKGTFKWLRYAGQKPDEWRKHYARGTASSGAAVVPKAVTLADGNGNALAPSVAPAAVLPVVHAGLPEAQPVLPKAFVDPSKNASTASRGVVSKSAFVKIHQPGAPVPSLIRRTNIDAAYVRNDQSGSCHCYIRLKDGSGEMEVDQESYTDVISDIYSESV